MPSGKFTEKFTMRLSLLNPEHVKIMGILRSLNRNVYKSQNQFIIEACLYYIDHYGAENLKEQEEKDEQDSDYVSRYEMEILEQRIREEAKKEAREEANKSVMTMIGSLVAGMQGNLNVPTAQKKYDPQDDDYDELTESDGNADDEVVAAYAEKWMMDSIGST
jgi:hypothetical protein